MGANCSNCNCNREEREHEINIDEKKDGSRVVAADNSFQNGNDNNDGLMMNDIGYSRG